MITLTFGTQSIQLRNPDFGDREIIEVRRIARKTRGGDLVVYRDSSWPKTATYTWQWSFLTQNDLTRLLYFMNQALGQEITIVDYQGRTLTPCIITTPADEVSQEGREDYKAGFTFQVEL